MKFSFLFIISLFPFCCYTATFIVTSTSDSNVPGSLRDAMNSANTAGGMNQIVFDPPLANQTITLTSFLPIIRNQLTIDGETFNITIDGANTNRIFFVDNVGPFPIQIQNLNLSNATAEGGAGGSSGGGGGSGMGGGLFCRSGSTVLIEAIQFANCSAKGGDGGDADSSGTFASGGGGGVSGGVGGSGTRSTAAGGGPGGGGFGGDGGSTLVLGAGGGGGGGQLGDGGGSLIGPRTLGGSGGGGETGMGASGGAPNDTDGGVGGSTGGAGGGGAGRAIGPIGTGGMGSPPGMNGANGSGTIGGNGGAGGLDGGGGGGGASDIFGVGGNSGAGGPGGDFGGGGGGGACSDTGVAGNGGDGGFGAGGGAGGSCRVSSGSQTTGAGGSGEFGGGGGSSGSLQFDNEMGNLTMQNGGDGGFGGGSGAVGSLGTNNNVISFGIPGLAGFGGGTGGLGTTLTAGGGGGGAGFGGGIFIQDGAALTMQSGSFSGNSVQLGTGGTGIGSQSTFGTDGIALGTDIFLMSGGILTFDLDSDVTVPNAIESDQGAGGGSGGGLNKMGTGALFLNGTNTYTGTTTISEGDLILNGSIITPVNISGGLFGGNATVLEDVTATGGRVSPGNSIGIIHVTGNYSQNATTTLDIEISSSGSNDLLEIDGTATLDGTVSVTPESGTYTVGQTFTFLTAALGRSGNFTNLVFTSPPGTFAGSLIYGSNFVQLLLTAIPASQFPIFKGNPGVVAKYLNEIDPATCSGLTDTFTQLLSLDNDQLKKALDRLQPSMLYGLYETQQEISIFIRSTISKRVYDLHSTNCCCCDPCSCCVNIWADGFYQSLDQSNFHSQKGFDDIAGGVVVGIDTCLCDQFLLGAFGSYTHANLDWNSSYGKAHINSWYGGVYGSWFCNTAYLDVSFLGGSNGYDTSRHIQFASTNEHAKGDHSGYELLGNISAGYGCEWCCVLIQTFVRGDYIFLKEDSFKEYGAGCLDLAVKSHITDFFRGEAGVNFSYCYVCPCTSFIPQLALSYVREWRTRGEHYKAGLKNYIDVNGFFVVKAHLLSRNLFAPEASITMLSHDDCLSIKVYYSALLGEKFWTQQAGLHLGWDF